MDRRKGPETSRTGETFLPLSRGLRRYQRTYTPIGVSLYLWVLQGADWRLGKDYGVLETSVAEMAAGLGLSRPSIKAALKELSRGYPFSFLSRSGETAPAFIEILAKMKRGRDVIYRIRLLKAKLRLADFDRYTGNNKVKSAPEAIEEEILGGKIREIQGIIGKTAASLDIQKLLTRRK